jgi:riboflavin kinase/FMN adenylyltransferase
VQATIDNRSFYGLTSIGTNPTVGGSHTTVETFFLDLDRDLYGKVLNIRFITHIRDEVHFDSIEDLISAIKDDEKFARAFITNNE